MYNPVGVDNAMLISACGRRVSVALASGEVFGVMEERNSGHSLIARESVLSMKGRQVRRLYFPVSGTSGGEGTGWTAAGFTARNLGSGGFAR